MANQSEIYYSPEGEPFPDEEWYRAEKKLKAKGVPVTTSNIQKAISGEFPEGESRPGDLGGTMKKPEESTTFGNLDLPYGEMDQLTLMEMGLKDIGRAALAEGYGEGMKAAWEGVEAKPSEVSGNVVQQMASFVQEGVRSPILSGLDKMNMMLESVRKNRNQARDDSRQFINMAMSQGAWNDMIESGQADNLWEAADMPGSPVPSAENYGAYQTTDDQGNFWHITYDKDDPRRIISKENLGLLGKSSTTTTTEYAKEYLSKSDRAALIAQEIPKGLINEVIAAMVERNSTMEEVRAIVVEKNARSGTDYQLDWVNKIVNKMKGEESGGLGEMIEEAKGE